MLQPTMTVNEAAVYLKKRPRTIREWIAAGKIAARKVGRSYVIPEAEVSRMIEPIRPADEVREYDPQRAARLAELRRVLAGLTVADVVAFQAEEREAMERLSRRSKSE